jgi:hypothetical protein
VLNVLQLVNIVLDSSTNYASWCDLMEQALQRYALIKHITDNAPSNDPGWIRMDNVVLNWIFTRWSDNVVARRATSGSPSRTSFSVTVSNILFTLMLSFVLLFKVTSRSMSTAASSRPWPTIWLTSAHPLKTGSSSSISFGAKPALRARGLHHSALLAISQLPQSSR